MSGILSSVRAEYTRYKAVAEAALRQLSDEQLTTRGPGDQNSVAIICRHISGNLRSRFTDFLTSDGEKPWRNRDNEFLAEESTQAEVLALWERGWTVLLETLDELEEADLSATVTIRGRELLLHEALHRSLAHVAYHVGQIVFLARSLKGDEWTFLSIAPGQTAAYNENPTLEKPGEFEQSVREK